MAIAGIGFGLYKLFKKQFKKENECSSLKNILEAKTFKVAYLCPGTLYSLLKSLEGLKTDTAKNIELLILDSKIKEYECINFWFVSILDSFKVLSSVYLQKNNNPLSLYLINENQIEIFENQFKPKCSAYELYKFKPTENNNLVCYALPLKRDSIEVLISDEITSENINRYRFKLNKEDAQKINLNEDEIKGVDFFSRRNKRNFLHNLLFNFFKM